MIMTHKNPHRRIRAKKLLHERLAEKTHCRVFNRDAG
jgi:hypothetical protein